MANEVKKTIEELKHDLDTTEQSLHDQIVEDQDTIENLREIIEELKTKLDDAKVNLQETYYAFNVLRDAYNKLEERSASEDCMWIPVDDPEENVWATQCGREFVLMDGAPTDNLMNYCCYCGKPLKQEQV